MGQLYQWEPFTEGEVSSPLPGQGGWRLGDDGEGDTQPLFFFSVGSCISPVSYCLPYFPVLG